MRHLARFCLVLCLCLPFLCTASATPIAAGTYALDGVTVNGSALTGTITLGNDGLATYASLSYANSAFNNPTFSNIVSKGFTGSNPTANFAYIAGGNGQVALYYLQALNPAGGIALCQAGSGCSQASSLQVYWPGLSSGLEGGSLVSSASLASSASPAASDSRTSGVVPMAVTPEPSTFVLMLTGVCVILATVVMRRSRQAAPLA